MNLSEKLKNIAARVDKPRTTPLWKGPSIDGVTFSLLSRFLSCRERFRLLVVEGLKTADTFNHRIEYGNLWHICEEYHAKGEDYILPLTHYYRELCKRYPFQIEQIDQWYNVCLTQFPLYVTYWSRHRDMKNRRSLLSEYTFNVPYELPGGDVVILKGKFDSVDLVEQQKVKLIYLQENKARGEIREEEIRQQLRFDLQTNIYLTVLKQLLKSNHSADLYNAEFSSLQQFSNVPVAGVRYNIIRRPLSGGAGTIRRHKPTKKNPQGESKGEYYGRVRDIILESPEKFFMRWVVNVSDEDINKFRKTCLDPILQQLVDWWKWIYHNPFDPFHAHGGGIHWVYPYGVYNPLAEGGSSDLDEYLATGSTVGLQVIDNLFPELK